MIFEGKVTDAEALEAFCPMCKARKDKPCTYMTDVKPKSRWDFRSRTYTKVSEGVHRRGDPLANGRVHQERRRKVWLRKRDAFWKEVAPKPTVSLSLIAVRAFDLDEYHAMQAWLRRWGPLLWSPPYALVPCPRCGVAMCDGNCEWDDWLDETDPASTAP